MFTIVIVGRPNVGKSTLFNRIAGKRKALVHNEPGVTRDLNYTDVEYEGKKFLLVDTGGILGASKDPLQSLVQEQAELAIEGADLVLFLVDSQVGALPVEKELAKKLRSAGKKVILAVNKVDEQMHSVRAADFYSMGIDPLVPLSAEHGGGVGDLLDIVKTYVPEAEEEEKRDDVVRVAIVGKPNVGKSSTLNRILGKSRVLVSDIPGTTRDPIDVTVEMDGTTYLFVDTAGIRKKSKTEKGAEILSVILARRALENCDVALLVVDASQKPSHQDAYIAGLIEGSQKSALVLLNKWDLVEGEKEAKERELLFREKFNFVPYVPLARVSAATGRGFKQLFQRVLGVYGGYSRKFSTSELNKFLGEAQRMVAPPAVNGKEFKVKYGTQVGSSPPRLVFFVNSTLNPPDNYVRYLKNKFYEMFELEGTPVIIHFRGRPPRS